MTSISQRFTARFTSLLATLALGATLGLPAAEAQTPPRGPDFNRDWYDDTAIGTGQEDWGSVNEAGMVSIGYGTPNGLDSLFGHLGWLTQNTAGLADSVEQGDLFGSALAWGDFDGDCYDDLVVGSYLEDLNGIYQAGAIHVVYGTANGLDGNGSQFLHRDVAGVAGVASYRAWFGSQLAAGDFDGDGYDDLAVAAEHETIGGVEAVGSLHIFYGSQSGLSTIGDTIFTRGGLGLVDEVYFGRTLAAGDFDCDGRDDLAIGTPFADPENAPNAGDVVVLYGSGSGLGPAGLQVWYQGDNGGLGGNLEHWDYVGTALAVGNFNGDVGSLGLQCLDLAIGAHIEDYGSIDKAGVVHVIYGTPGVGLQNTFPADQAFTQQTAGVLDTSETLDEFGYSLVAGRFNNDGYDDLAIGVRGEDLGGAVAVLRGAASGLSTSGDILWSQDTAGITGTSEDGDGFGSSLGYTHRSSDDGSTLLVGVPFEDLNGTNAAGFVNAITFASHQNQSLVLSSEVGLEQSTFGGSSREFADRFGEYQLAPRHVPFRCPM